MVRGGEGGGGRDTIQPSRPGQKLVGFSIKGAFLLRERFYFYVLLSVVVVVLVYRKKNFTYFLDIRMQIE
jgi:hypothetical protein